MIYRNTKLKFLDKTPVSDYERRMVKGWVDEGGAGE